MSPTTFGWLILAFPLVGMLVVSLGYRAWSDSRTPAWIASAAILGSFLCSVGALLSLLDRAADNRIVTDNLWVYAKTESVDVGIGILVDPLAVFMCLVVSGVSFLIHVYSSSYMSGDRGYTRFFAYLNYFVFSMLLLVLAGNFILLIVGWAFVGAASYLLISFWYRRSTATKAGIKAFVINVIGDVGLVIAAFLLFRETGALDYIGVFSHAQDVFTKNDGTLIAACLLLLVGAFAKSAQLPLHTWLPDAMEGPTPVSALIHAATMVTAGVYLIARMHPLFELAPTAADISAVIGTLTLLFAATVALAVTDLKRVIAYSTMSQIGYMILGVSVFAYSAGLFHLMTHAFFKALLFMGAGSVISAMGGEQSLDRMGGLRKAMPFTFATFTIGALALSGIPPFAGFWSKDDILDNVIHRGGWFVALAVVGYVAALMTAVYSFRMVFRVFFGDPVPEAASLERGELAHGEHRNPATGEEEDTDVGFPAPEHHIAERAVGMKFAMAPLALLATVGGIVQIPGVTDALSSFLAPTFESYSSFHDTEPTVRSEYLGLGLGAVLGIIGVGVAWSMYRHRPGTTARLIRRLPAVHRFLFNKWYFDEIYDRTIVRPIAAFGTFGHNVIESDFVQGVFVGGATGMVRAGSDFARGIQNGYLRAYAGLFIFGLTGLGLYFLVVST